MPIIINKKYRLIEKIGNGSFGTLFKAENVITNQLVAIKMENICDEIKMLKNETKIYQFLKGTLGVPAILYFGIYETKYYMVLPLLGVSLRDVRENHGPFSLNDTISICENIIKILLAIHEKGLIHRDVKPHNFLLNNNKNNKNNISIIDFGFCKRYLKDDNTHIDMRTGCTPIGSPNYMSINIHNGIEPSRRDDLESVGYMMLYFLGIPYEATAQSKLNVIYRGNMPDKIRNYLISCLEQPFQSFKNVDINNFALF